MKRTKIQGLLSILALFVACTVALVSRVGRANAEVSPPGSAGIVFPPSGSPGRATPPTSPPSGSWGGFRHDLGTIHLSVDGQDTGPLELKPSQGGYSGEFTISNIGADPLTVSRVALR